MSKERMFINAYTLVVAINKQKAQKNSNSNVEEARTVVLVKMEEKILTNL
jgi:hypothetical protein